MSQVLGVGCDIVGIERIARMAQRNPAIFLGRIFGEQERAALGLEMDWRRCARHVAAKEACFKALGSGLIGAMRWSDVQVIDGCGTQLLISGAAYEQMQCMGPSKFVLSITDSGEFAIAMVLWIRQT